ncbi:MAG: hypothetical protein Q4B52_01130 [Tissierellia bacterium]|nr:hypothetical protein [Tissierellia bacterium]
MKRRQSWLATQVTDEQAGNNVSWSAVFAGAVTFIAVFFLLSLIGSAIGFGLVSPTESNPLDGVSTGLLIWTAIQFIISLYCAGFVSGIAARRVGLLHGFLTWALSLVLSLVLITYSIAGIFSVVGSLFKTAGDAFGNVAGGVGNVASDAAGKAGEQITSALDDTNFDEVKSNMEKYLQDTDNEKLQPDYLEGQLQQSADEIKEAATEAAKNPDKAEQIAKDTADSLKDRAKNISDSVKREDIASAVSQNSDLSEEEANEITDNIYNGIQEASKKSEEAINEAQKQINETINVAEEKVEEGREVAEDATNTTAKASIITFIGLVIGAVVSMLGGMSGSRVSRKPEVERN